VLPLLVERRLLPAESERELATAYEFLRRLEHRLQYVADAQTHMLPTGDDERQAIATSMGFADWPAFCSRARRAPRASSPATSSRCSPNPRKGARAGRNLVRAATAATTARSAFRHSASASRKAMLERVQGFRQSAKYQQLPAQQPRASRRLGAAPDRSRRGDDDARRDLAARPRLSRHDQPARRLSRTAAAVSAGAEEARRDHRQLGPGQPIT
jgi:glutamate-ammonia-ligase adenylyltransferase